MREHPACLKVSCYLDYVYDISMETINGQEVAEAKIQAWAEEAEAGYDAVELKKRARVATDATADTKKFSPKP